MSSRALRALSFFLSCIRYSPWVVVESSSFRMSAILSADDLNDFISPGVACIKPIETLPQAAQPEDGSVGRPWTFFGRGDAG